MSQRELARRTGISHAHVHHAEKGTRSIGADILLRYVEGCGGTVIIRDEEGAEIPLFHPDRDEGRLVDAALTLTGEDLRLMADLAEALYLLDDMDPMRADGLRQTVRGVAQTARALRGMTEE